MFFLLFFSTPPFFFETAGDRVFLFFPFHSNSTTFLPSFYLFSFSFKFFGFCSPTPRGRSPFLLRVFASPIFRKPPLPLPLFQSPSPRLHGPPHKVPPLGGPLASAGARDRGTWASCVFFSCEFKLMGRRRPIDRAHLSRFARPDSLLAGIDDCSPCVSRGTSLSLSCTKSASLSFPFVF